MIAVIFAGGKGKRLRSVTRGAPKHLLEVDPDNRDPLKRTVIGRLVSQFVSRPEIERVVVLCRKEKSFKAFFSGFPHLKEKVQLTETPKAYNWKENFRILSEVLGEKPGIVVPGDLIIQDKSIDKAIKSAKKGKQLTLLFSFKKNVRFFSLKTSVALWIARKGIPEWGKQLNPERWGDLPKLLYRHRKDVGFGLTRRFMNINTPQDLKRARTLLKRKRFK